MRWAKEGMFFAARTLMQKFGQTFGVLIFAMLTTFGKDPGDDLGIRLSGMVGFVLTFVAGLVFTRDRRAESTGRTDQSRGISVTYLDPLAAPFYLEGSNGEGVLLVHGFGGSAAHVRMLGDHLNANGYTVHGPLLEGHGTRLEDMETTGRSDWLESARRGFGR